MFIIKFLINENVDDFQLKNREKFINSRKKYIFPLFLVFCIKLIF